jgi:hypothetical protein
MDDNISKAFDTAQDVSKQLLTLAAGIVVLTITFFSDFGKHAPSSAKDLFFVAWLLYTISLIGGIGTLQTLAGNLQHAHLDIYKGNTVFFSIVQYATFVAALALTVIAGAQTWL